MKKVITFQKTDKGHLILVNGVIVWFIRYENIIGKGGKYMAYRSSDCGIGFKLIPAVSEEDTSQWGHNSLKAAQDFAVNYETK